MPPPADRLPIFIVTAPGLEALAAHELRSLGLAGTAEPGGVATEGALDQLYACNLRLRTASRVLVRLGEFRARTFYELERHAARLEWERYIGGGRTIRLRVTSRKSKLYHEGAIAERLLGALERRAGPLGGVTRADSGDEQDERDADAQLFIVRFFYDRCTVSADASGALLHLRGYRQALGRAPLRETLAAAMLLASGWEPGAPLLDPMCGAGTIPIEAALIARRIAPGLANPALEPRRYAFQEWPGFEAGVWSEVVAGAAAEARPAAEAPIHGSDRDAGGIAAAAANAERAGVRGDVQLEVRALSGVEPPAGAGWLVSNPPYGVRLGERQRLRDLYAALGSFARRELSGWTIALLSADPRLEAQVGIRFDEVVSTRNGGIPVRVVVGRIGG